MKTLVVTAMYDLYQDPEFKSSPETSGWSNRWLSIEFRLKHLEILLSCDIDIVLFTQRELIDLINIKNPRLKIIPLELDEITTYKKVIDHGDLILPHHRNATKDKIEYFALMNSKTDLMRLAHDLHPTYDHYAWIDGSIFKLFKNTDLAQHLIVEIANKALPDNIISPRGDRSPLYALDAIWIEQVLWRFLGSILIIPSHMLIEFCDACDQTLYRLMQRNRITWEINIWARVESLYMRPFVAYRADHNESILRLPSAIDPREYGEPNVIK
jgi:hypothetical protein